MASLLATTTKRRTNPKETSRLRRRFPKPECAGILTKPPQEQKYDCHPRAPHRKKRGRQAAWPMRSVFESVGIHWGGTRGAREAVSQQAGGIASAADRQIPGRRG